MKSQASMDKAHIIKALVYGYIGLFVYLLIGLFYIAYAQTPATPHVVVSPSIVRLDLSVDKPEAVLTYENRTNQPMELSFQAQNFTQLENTYQLSFLEGKDANNYKYGLSSWIQFSNKTLLLNPHEIGNVTVFIEKDKLSPGGHYATILAHINPQQATNQQVQVNGILASLLFVRTNTGIEKESATLPSFDAARNLFDFPDTFYFRFNNTGDTDLIPYGLAQVVDSQKNLVAKGIVNENSAPTLPQSIRRYYVSTGNLKSVLFPGFYTATIALHFGKSQQHITATKTFFSQGSIPLLPIGIGLLVGIGGILFVAKKRLKNHEGV